MFRLRLTLPLAGLLLLTACGGPSSGLNPLRWFGSSPQGPQSLEPAEGYVQVERRQDIARITGARWEPLNEGRMLIVTGLAPTKGWWDAALVPQVPASRVRADEDGVLRLRFVAVPPPPDLPVSRIPARPEVDTITVAITLSTAVLRNVEQVTIQGAGNAITLRR